MNDRIRTLLLEANGTHWAAICVDTIGQGAFTSRHDTRSWVNRSPRLRKLFGERYADASYMTDWREAFLAHPGLAVETCNITNLVEFWRNRPKLRSYDLVIVLHSAAGDRMSVLGRTASWFRERRGKLAMFIGNEYDLLEEKIAFAREAASDYICTQLPLDAARQLYSDCDAELVAMPHALNPQAYRPRPDIARTIDVGFVGDLYERLIGDRERTDIVQFFRTRGALYGLVCDLRARRLAREGWSAFLSACYAVIGAESGTYFLQRDGNALKCARTMVKRRPDVSFETVVNECFTDPGPVINGKAVSSRHFEPIGTKTCQVLIEGDYNGILSADRHYIAVRKDLSNIDEAIRRLKDTGCRQTIAEAAYDHVLGAHTYAHRVAHLLETLFPGVRHSPATIAAGH